MRRFLIVSLNFLFCFSILLVSSCGKQPRPVAPIPVPTPTRSEVPSQPSAPAPTVTINASPGTIERGGQTTLSWQSTDASSLLIDSGVGNVASPGSMVVSPRQSTTYTATATGPGGEATSSTRVTVVASRDAIITSTDIEKLQEAIEEGRIQPVFFAYDKAQLTADARRTLEGNARWFREFEDASIVIEGHCDERGTEEYNLALGDRRAQVAKNYLVGLGIQANRLQTISYGEERPFAAGYDEGAYRLNRRAHFVVDR